MTDDPRPISSAPIDTEIMIFAPTLSKGWLKAVLSYPRCLRSTEPRWRVYGLPAFAKERGVVMRRGFQPEMWKPLEREHP